MTATITGNWSEIMGEWCLDAPPRIVFHTLDAISEIYELHYQGCYKLVFQKQIRSLSNGFEEKETLKVTNPLDLFTHCLKSQVRLLHFSNVHQEVLTHVSVNEYFKKVLAEVPKLKGQELLLLPIIPEMDQKNIQGDTTWDIQQ